MTTVAGFHPITEVTADERSRIAFGRLGVHRDDRYAVSTNDDGEILLTPIVSIPKRELIIWKNPDLMASIQRGLLDAAEGRTRELDWVTSDAEPPAPTE